MKTKPAIVDLSQMNIDIDKRKAILSNIPIASWKFDSNAELAAKVAELPDDVSYTAENKVLMLMIEFDFGPMINHSTWDFGGMASMLKGEMMTPLTR